MSDLLCLNCRNIIGDIFVDFCFYTSDDNTVHLIVRPEILNEFLDKNTVKTRTSTDNEETYTALECSRCDFSLGGSFPYGPQNVKYFALACLKVKISSDNAIILKGKPNWFDIKKRYPAVSDRKKSNFYGNNVDFIDVVHFSRRAIVYPLKLPTETDLEAFDWKTLLRPGKTPRSYQIKGFVQSSLDNTILVMPTGTGKTLVATMTIRYMCSLNPHRIALMIVDRINLVFQQRAAIQDDTDLKVLGLYGGNKTINKIKQLYEGLYDVLVITDGCLMELLKAGIITSELFSVVVFDECHKALSAQSKYSQILRKIADDTTLLPRILGLTASPFSFQNANGATRSEQKLQDNFPARLYRPNTFPGGNGNVEEYIVIKPTTSELQMLDQLKKLILLKIKEVNKNSVIPLDEKLVKDEEWVRFRNQVKLCDTNLLRSESEVDDKDMNTKRKNIHSINFLLSVIDINDLIGATEAKHAIEKYAPELLPQLSSVEQTNNYQINRSSQHSGRFEALVTKLRQVDITSRILVFVDTRYAARLLYEKLNTIFSEMNPKYIVGHGGWDGMDWEGEGGQKPVIDSFKVGESRLVVSTSVLEEGVDIGACNLVFRFRGFTSLIQFIQSRGRARKKGGKIILILPEKEKIRALNIRYQESILDNKLSKYKEPSPAAQRILNHVDFPSTDSEDFNENIFDESSSDDHHFSSEALSFFISNSIKSVDVIHIIQEAFYDICNCDVSRVEVYRGGAVRAAGSMNIFDIDDDHIILSLKSPKPGTIYDFCRTWNFMSTQISLISTNNATSSGDGCMVWLQAKSSENKISNISTLCPVNISVGEFDDKRTFVHYADLSQVWNGSSLHLTNQSLTLASNFNLIIPMTSLLYCVILSTDRTNNVITMYLTVSSTPKVNDISMIRNRISLTEIIGVEDNEIIGVEDNEIIGVEDNEIIGVEDNEIIGVENVEIVDIEDVDFIGIEDYESVNEDLLHLSKSNVIAIHFNVSNWEAVVALATSLSLPAFHSNIMTISKMITYNNLSEILSLRDLSDPWRSLSVWSLAVLLENRTLGLTCKSKCYLFDCVRNSLINNENVDELAVSLQQLPAYLQNKSYCADSIQIFNTLLNSYISRKVCHPIRSDSSNSNSYITAGSPLSLADLYLSVPEGYCNVNRVYVTPTRIIPFPAALMKNNRMLRSLMHQYAFVIVRFVDEEFQCGYNSEYISRIALVIRNGITVLGIKYYFLCSSASQKRTQSAFFIAVESKKDIIQIRNNIVQKPIHTKISAAKYSNWLALFCTSDSPTIPIDMSDDDIIKRLDDKNTFDNHLLTDGCGIISKALAKKVFAALREREPKRRRVITDNNLPCAFQYRLGGTKGVLQVKNDPVKESVGALVQVEEDKSLSLFLRPSMKKFTSSHNEFCVVQTCQYIPLYLNREIINLLESLSGMSKKHGVEWEVTSVFRDMQEEVLSDTVRVFSDYDLAHQALTTYLNDFEVKEVIDAGFDILSEPLWLSLLHVIYQKKILDLRTKTKLFVKEGCLLMGVSDETGSLKQGEVFVCFQKPDELSITVITGPVLVYRNPCLHPGDLRRVIAVDRPILRARYTANVIVMSIDATGPSLSTSCSGGDLDGDLYGIIWNAQLIPPEEAIYPPLDYDEIARTVDDISVDDTMESFIIKVYGNDTLGIVARLHVAVCDQIEDGACNSLAIELSKAQSLAVDFPKTGKPPLVPEACLDIVKNFGYPDFMEKNEEVSYQSKKVMGVMYRRVRSINLEAAVVNDHTPIDIQLQCPQEEVALFEQEARQVYDLYKICVGRLILRFALKSEAELFLGECLHWDSLLYDRSKARGALRASWRALKNQFHHIFFDDSLIKNRDNRESDSLVRSKAFCWYKLAYSTTTNLFNRFDSDKSCCWNNKCLTFPWIVSEILCKIKSDRCRSPPITSPSAGLPHSVLPSLYLSIGNSALLQFQKSIPMLEGLMEQRKVVVYEVTKCISDYVSKITASASDSDSGQSHAHLQSIILCYGSYGMFLCEVGSDVDIFFSIKETELKSVAISESPRKKKKKIEGGAVKDNSAVVSKDNENNRNNQSRVDNAVNDGTINELPEEIPTVKQECLLGIYVMPAIDTIANEKRLLEANHIPFIRFTVGDEDNFISVDISSHCESIDKCLYIRQLYSLHPTIFPLFSLLVSFARVNGIIRSNSIGMNVSDISPPALCMIRSSAWHALIISFVGLDKQAECQDSTNHINSTQKAFYNTLNASKNLNDIDKERLGYKLFLFFKTLACSTASWKYIWPIRNAPVDEIPTTSMQEISRLCLVALHSLAYTRSWECTLTYLASVDSSNKRLKIRLPRTAIYAIVHYESFHKARLEYRSGARVSFEKEGVGLGNRPSYIIGEGNTSSITKLRNEIRQLFYDSKLSSLGRPPERTSAYFMEGASIVFLKGYLKRDALLKFSDYFGLCQYKHRMKHLSVPSAFSGDSYIISKDNWMEAFLVEFEEKIISQLSPLVTYSEEVINSLFFSVHFGIFYIIGDLQKTLANTNGKMTVQILEDTINRGRRKHLRELGYDEATVELARSRLREAVAAEAAKKEQSFSMVAVSEAGEGGSAKAVNTKSEKVSLGSSFYPGVWGGIIPTNRLSLSTQQDSNNNNNNNNSTHGSSSTTPPPAQPVTSLEVLSHFLTTLGFQLYESENRHSYNVNFVAASSFSVDLGLDADLNFVYLRDRPVSWVHGTVLDSISPISISENNAGGNQRQELMADSSVTPLASRHVRIKICTMQSLSIDCDIYRLLYPPLIDTPPTNHSSPCKPPIVLDEAGNTISPASHLPVETRKRITYIRKIVSKHIFRCEELVGLEAKITSGYNIHFAGGRQQSHVPFLEVSLMVSTPSPLSKWVRNECTRFELSIWMKSICEVIFSVSEYLSSLGLH